MSAQHVLGLALKPFGRHSKNWASPIKKTLRHPKADQDARLAFQKKIQTYRIDGRPIIYVDESGFAHDMPRLHGYSARGERCTGIQNWHAKGRINVIGALLGTTLLTISLFACNIDSTVFHAWAVNDLLPKLPPASVVVLDNASFHKRQDLQCAFSSSGHSVEFLPPYSPDLNPIEHKWAQAKSIRRTMGCSVNELFSRDLL